MSDEPVNTPPVCSYEGSDYQSRFWDSANRRYEDAVEAVALSKLFNRGGKLLLELGAGAGRNTPRYQNWDRIVLLDYSRTQLLQARERLGESSDFLYVAADIYKLPFVSGLFDGSTMIRTLHHMADPIQTMRSIRRGSDPNHAVHPTCHGYRRTVFAGICQQTQYQIRHALAAEKAKMESIQPGAGRVCRVELQFPPKNYFPDFEGSWF